ncbi:hypothetical protein JKF63_02243 [Porcisia hertigi]|uniref:Uncharacterized protein n=1 Tax=Porcisia hertigi TaxID=2761500 RepID=A0A836LCJ2_9TRYP|nr:hypothetical protein JKF63_02243 [Porcisia hertigi]
MAQLHDSLHTMPDVNNGPDVFSHTTSSIGGGAKPYLTPGYQLFRGPGGACVDANTDSDNADNVQQSLSIVLHAIDGDEGGSRCSRQHNQSPPKRSAGYPDDRDDEDDDTNYLETLLRNIDRHAARLDTKFYRYPPSDVIKQQMASTAPLNEVKTKGRAAASGNGAASAASNSVTVSAGEDGVAEDQLGTGGAVSSASPSSRNLGTKLFLGGLRYEVIQSGRHMVCWIFQVACSVRLSPSSILIHRKTKNGRSNVAPTGCASVFVSNEEDVEALLGVNQRIYCAEEGVYVSPSPEVMKELIASKDIVDVTAGRVRGPIHPIVIERAYSFRHHHSQREGGSSGTRALGGNGGGAAAAGSGGGHPQASTVSLGRTESSASSEHHGSMPPPYDGNMQPPQYGSPPTSLLTPGSVQSHSHTSSSLSSSIGMGSATMAGGLSARENSTALYPYSSVLSCESSTPTQSVLGDAVMLSSSPTARAGSPQRITFHAYLRSDAASHMSSTLPSASGPMTATTPSTPEKCTALFVAALPTETTTDYVSWLFSLMAITLPPSHIHVMDSGSATLPTGTFGGASSTGATKKMPDCCATVSLDDNDISIALNYHHRVLCTPRGAWIGYSAQDIANLRASDASVRDFPALHVGRRMCAPTLAGVGHSGAPALAAAGYPCGGAGGEYGSSGAAPYSPSVFSGMPMLPATAMGAVGNGMPFSMPWGLGMPPSSSHCMHAGMPPPPLQSAMMGSAAPPPAMGTGASLSLPPPPPNFTMPPQGMSGIQQPPFPLTQTVTIGDRVYQLPPGATLQFVPVITSANSARTGGAAKGGWRSGSADQGAIPNVEASLRPNGCSNKIDIPLRFSK